MNRLRFAPLFVLGALLACAPAIAVRTHPPAERHPISTLAVYPFVLRWDPESTRPVALGDRLALRMARAQTCTVWGPSDLGLDNHSVAAFPLPADGPLASRLAGANPGLAVLSGWAEWHLSGAEAPKNPASPAGPSPGGAPGRGRGQAQGPRPDSPDTQNTYSLHLELFDSAGHLLAEAESAPSNGIDVEAGVDRLADRMLEAMQEVAPATPAHRRPWWNSQSLTVAGPRVEDPSAECAAAGLRSGDVVLTVGSQAATDLVIERERRLAPAGGTVPVLVRRTEGEVTLNLPAGS